MNNLDSMRYKILELTGISGELPADQLSRLISSPSYCEKLITGLKKEKLIRTHYRDKLRGFRLTKKSKQLLLKNNPKRFQFYLTGNTETNQVRSKVSRRVRLYQKAQAYITYSSREIKALGEITTKIKNSRSVGMLLTDPYVSSCITPATLF